MQVCITCPEKMAGHVMQTVIIHRTHCKRNIEQITDLLLSRGVTQLPWIVEFLGTIGVFQLCFFYFIQQRQVSLHHLDLEVVSFIRLVQSGATL